MISFRLLMFFGIETALSSLLLLVAGCEHSSSQSALAITPSSVIASSSSTTNIIFTASGGTPPYTWSVNNSSLGTIAGDDTNAVYTAYPAPGLNGVVVTDSDTNTASAIVTQGYETTSQGLTITPASITVGASVTNNIAFTVSGSNPPYTWAVSNPNLGDLNAAGNSGVYTTFEVTGQNSIVVSDTLSHSVSATVTQE